MRWIAAARERLAALFFSSRLDAELDEELRFHVEHEVGLLREAGLDPQEARRQALQRLGGVEQCKEAVRDARGVGIVDDVVRDLAIAARSLARRPVLSLGVAVTLGLGIGATTTMYAVVDGVMVRPLPYEEPSTLITVGAVSPLRTFVAPGVQDLGPISILHYQQLRARARSFDTLVAVNVQRLMPIATPDGGETNVRAHEISSGLLEMLGTTAPALGRLFLAEEYDTPQEGAVMVTFEEWQGRYGGDPGIIGRTIGRIRGGRFPAVVVGVLPPDFRPLEAFFASGERPGYYFPRAPELMPEDRGWEPWYVMGRLRPGVSISQARAEVDGLAADVAREVPAAVGLRQRDGSPYRLGLNGLEAQTVGASRQVLAMFMGAAALLLVLAAMNAAMLVVGRSLDRSKEFGIRMALGAGRTRLVRLIMCEAGILAIAGGALGTLIAYGGVEAFLRFAPPSIPRLSAIVLDARVLAVAAAMSIAAGIAVGLLPALRLTRWSPWEPLQAGAHSPAEPASRRRSVLIAGQMALAIVLLAGAGLLFNSFVRMRSVDPGIDADRLVTLTVPYKDTVLGRLPLPQAWDTVLDELRAVPGVESVAGTTTAPFQTPFWSLQAGLPGDPPETWRSGIAGYVITPDYLETVGTRLLVGRTFNRLDGPGTERVALVNDSFVRTQLDGADAVGKVVHVTGNDEAVRIVGVVEDVIQQRAEEGFRPAIYVPYTQYRGAMFVVAVVRTSLPAEATLDSIRAVSARLSPRRQPDVRVMRELMTSTLTAPRFRAMLIGVFAVAATILAAVGLYAAMAHYVERRRRELAIRMALGGNRAAVVALVLGRGLRLSISGLAVGVVAALVLSRMLRGLLFELEAHDPATFVMVVGVLVLVSAAASVMPARRATAVDPVTLLKAE